VPYYIGIDGGGSKTTCAVGDASTLLSTATAGPSNVVRVGEAQARESLHQCVRQACAAAGITPAQVMRTCLGGSGAARPEIAAIVHRALAEILPTAIDVVGDMQIALEAAFASGPGVVVNAGTGSFAYGRDPQGVCARVGGWGFAVSDEGSAHWIGRAAITAALRSADLGKGSPRESAVDGDPPRLHALMKAWDIASFDDFIRAANSTPPPNFAALFPVVLASVEAGDIVAQNVLTRAGTELAQLAEVAIRRLFPVLTPAPALGTTTSPVVAAAVPVAMAGGVFRHATLVRQVFYNELRKLGPRADVNPQVVNPVEGALSLARSACGADTPFGKLRAGSVRHL
jgi:glucosamine kinase